MPQGRGSWTADGGRRWQVPAASVATTTCSTPLTDPGHERHKDLQAWVAGTAGPWQEFDPEQLDSNAVNNKLALLFPAPFANEHGLTSDSLTQELTSR
jgi:hypothetical protein